MNTRLLLLAQIASFAGAIALLGCSSSSDGTPASATDAVLTPSDVQTPPTGSDADISAWLAKGDYKTWKCEPAPHDARRPSPHGKNRICSNDVLSAHGAGEFPVGAAGVKELYDSTGTKVVGHAMYRKLAVGGGEAWYWFEKTDADGVVANGAGTAGTPKTVCVGCHEGAGSDATHSGHDQVYTQVK